MSSPARIYESQVRQSLTIQLFNNGQGFPIASAYHEAAKSNRKFMKDTPIDGEAIRLTKQTLTSEWAALANQAGKSNEFDEVEIDILFHVHSPHVNKPTVGPELSMIALNPKQDRLSLMKLLPIGDPIPNRYIAVEVILDFKMILGKLVQVERILTLLLERKKLHGSSEKEIKDLLVSDIIQFAGIACPGNPLVKSTGGRRILLAMLEV
ncbi:hypothetical protein MP638_001716 [Amoeboaphelidium occidentale]|nr:hypothetical protein MP638_001716 [Amoeboaphelidium occidentale]